MNALLLFSCWVVSDSLWPHGLQHARLSCPSLSPGVSLNSCPVSWWCHPTISSSFSPFSSCLQSFPGSGSFPVSRLFPSGGQSTGAPASLSVLPMNIQDWFPWGLTSLISLLSKGLSRVFSNTTPKASILRHSAFFMVQLSHLYIVKALSCVHLFATTVYGIFQARILEWVAISFSRSSWPRDHWSPTLQADFLPSEPPHD